MVLYFESRKRRKKYLPADNLPIYCKTANNTMYQQLNDAIEVFKSEENVKETLHDYSTQQNEALNMAVSRYVPKFKHFGTTTSLDTRIRCVIGTQNMSYRTFYSTLLKNLGCLDSNDLSARPILSGISRIDEAKIVNKKYKQRPQSKRQRKYGLLAKTK